MKSKQYNVSAIVFYSVIIAIALGLPKIAFAAPVTDTGQTKCYSNTVEIPCPQPGQTFYGQDAQYGTNLHSYTDLGNGIIRDSVTGLEWQQATAPDIYTRQQALDYCDNLVLGGYDGWRLPTIKELSTLADSSIPPLGPAINTTFFPDTRKSFYWSSTIYAYSPTFAWFAHFSKGSAELFLNSGSYEYVRAVRGEPLPENNFIDNGDGTITDTNTSLMWQKATAPGTYTWEQALTYCEGLTLAGYSDWRLPNRNELQSIVDYNRYNPSINITYFPGTEASYYWSSTSYVQHPNEAWFVEFSGGGVYRLDYTNNNSDNYKTYEYYVRAVRGGQSEPTQIRLVSFVASPLSMKLILNWSTASEVNTAGFNLYRSESENGEYTQINTSLIPAQGSSTEGASYKFIDTEVKNRRTYYYKLEDIDINGISTMHGPVSATPRWVFGIFGMFGR